MYIVYGVKGNPSICSSSSNSSSSKQLIVDLKGEFPKFIQPFSPHALHYAIQSTTGCYYYWNRVIYVTRTSVTGQDYYIKLSIRYYYYTCVLLRLLKFFETLVDKLYKFMTFDELILTNDFFFFATYSTNWFLYSFSKQRIGIIY